MTKADPQVVVSVNNDIVILVGTPESFVIQSNNKEYVKAAKANTEKSNQVPLLQDVPFVTFPTGKSTLLELVASIVAIDPAQAVILEAPEEVTKALEDVKGPQVPGAIY
jgi:ketopantoate hydroxymethyltransferase